MYFTEFINRLCVVFYDAYFNAQRLNTGLD